MKKFTAIMLAILMVLSCTMTASASDIEPINENVDIVENVDTVEATETVEANADTVDVAAVETVETTEEVHKHVFSYAIDEVGHVMSCSECGVNVGAEEAHTFSSTSSCTVCGYSVHTCNIARANERYHSYDCDICENDKRVYHDEENMKVTLKNDYFHSWDCGCGYSYTEEHDFNIAYTTTSHQEICEDCGYKSPIKLHEFENDFYRNYHDIICDWCGFVQEHHVSVKYATIDAHSCQATCSCGAVDMLEHNFNGFTCQNCNYEITGITFGIVENISEREDYDRVKLVSGNETFRINFDFFDYEEGDFIIIKHHGDTIFEITCLVEGEIVEHPEHTPLYIASDVISQMGYVGYTSNTVKEVCYDDDNLVVTFEDGRTLEFSNFEVYDFENGEVVDADFICKGERLVWYTYDDVTYILDYYY